MKHKGFFRFFMAAAILLCAVMAAGAAPAKTKIRIGWVTSLTGPESSVVPLTYGMVYDLWIEQVNAKGGIYVKEYKKRLPLEVIKYDDTGDVGTMTKLLEKAILQDKVDFIFPPHGTTMLYAAAPVANKYKYILMGGPGGAVKLKEISSKLPYFFSVLNMAETQMPALADVFAELGITKVAVIYQQDLHGVEYRDLALQSLKKKGMEIVLSKGFPMSEKDFKVLLTEAKNAGAEAMVAAVYPDFAFPITAQAMEIGFNPKAFYMTLGPDLAQFRDTYGAKAVEGIMGGGAWNTKVSAGAKKFAEDFKAKYNSEPEYWGTLFYYSSLQFWQKAVEEAGTLNQAKIRDLIATKTYDTAMGPMKFVQQFNTNHPGEVGQWQNGVFEVVDTGAKRTAKPILKPSWPAK